jgi:hypothetical protein
MEDVDINKSQLINGKILRLRFEQQFPVMA